MIKARLERQYKKSSKYKIMNSIGINNVMCIPKIQKIVVSISSKEVIKDSKIINKIFDDAFLITGQKPVITKAKKSVANFKLREGTEIGVKVTLRNRIMYEFLDRLVNIILPRLRDFKGFSIKKFDKQGNYSLGIKEQIIFPEIDYNKVDRSRGIGVVIVTNSKDNKHAKILLKTFNFPFLD